MRSLENRTRANLKCHFGGLAIVIPELEAAGEGKTKSPTNPKATDYDVEAARKASYETKAELVYDRYGTGGANRPGNQQPALCADMTGDALIRARQKIFDTLKATAEIAEVSDLYRDNRFKGSTAIGAFAPIYFVYRQPANAQPPHEAERGLAKRFYFVYNGRFLIASAFCEIDTEIPDLQEIVSEVCLLMSRSGYEFRWLSPAPTLQSLDQGGITAASSQMSTVLNDSVGQAGMATSLFIRMPRNVQDTLRSLYAASFQSLMAFCNLKEESDTQEALFQTIEAQREAVLDLMHEFNQTRERHFLRRRKLRKDIRAHCLSLTEKIGRVDTISDAIAQGITSLDSGLKEEPEIRRMLEREPGWRTYLHNDIDTEAVLGMITRTSEEISRHDLGLVVFLVALLAAIGGGFVGAIFGRFM